MFDCFALGLYGMGWLLWCGGCFVCCGLYNMAWVYVLWIWCGCCVLLIWCLVSYWFAGVVARFC